MTYQRLHHPKYQVTCHSGIHIALKENDMTGAHLPRDLFMPIALNETSPNAYFQANRGAKFEYQAHELILGLSILSVISTLRFSLLPSSVLFDFIGFSCPMPKVLILDGRIPRPTIKLFTVFALEFESFLFDQ